ncbi:hypothetical protein GCM10009800_36440 [Nocardiopsis rhodophaea]
MTLEAAVAWAMTASSTPKVQAIDAAAYAAPNTISRPAPAGDGSAARQAVRATAGG